MTPGVVVYRLDDRLFFANAGYVKGRVREAIRAAPTETAWFVFDAEAVNHVDSTGMEALLDLTRDLRREGITLVVARLRSRMRPDFAVAGLTEEIGAEHFYPSVKLAVDAFLITEEVVCPNDEPWPELTFCRVPGADTRRCL